MFENSEVRTTRRSAAFWLTLVFCLLAALFLINLVRVNVPDRKTAAATPFVAPHTEGTIASEVARIDAGGFLSFRANFIHRATVNGQFRVDGNGPWVTFLILDEDNYQKWRAGEEFAAAVSTGRVPSGRVARVLEAGTYFLIFDNRLSETDVVLDIDLRSG